MRFLPFIFFLLFVGISSIPTLLFAADSKLLALTMLDGYVNNLPEFFNRLMNVAIFIGALLAVLMISIAGVQYMTSEAVGGIESAKKRLRQAIIGLLMLLSVYIFYNQINPQILNINFTLKPVTIKIPKKINNTYTSQYTNNTIQIPLSSVGNIQTEKIICDVPGELSCQLAIQRCLDKNANSIKQDSSHSLICSYGVSVDKYTNELSHVFSNNAIKKWADENEYNVIKDNYPMNNYENASQTNKESLRTTWAEECTNSGGSELKYVPIGIVPGLGNKFQYVCIK